MSRYFRWLLLAAFLMITGAWPAAAAPVSLVGAGLAVVIGAIPGSVLALLAAVAWLKYRPAPAVA